MWILLTACIVSFITLAKGDQTTCNATDVVRGETASITCYFGKDISKLQQEIKVIQYLANNKNAVVLSCQWTGGELKCNVRPTYAFDDKITDTLRVFIHDAQTTHAGKYACFIVPAEGQFDFCHLKVRDITTSCEAPPAKIGENASITCHFSENIHNLHRRIKIQHYASLTSKSVNVLICDWSLNASRECNIRPTYSFDHIITDKLTMQIPQANQGHNGSYVCFVMPAASDTFKLCNLLIQDNLPFREGALTKPSICINVSTITDTSKTNCLDRLSSEQQTTDDYAWKIAIACIVSFTIPTSIAIIFCFYRRKTLCIQEEKKQDIMVLGKKLLQSDSEPTRVNTGETTEIDTDTEVERGLCANGPL